MTTQNINQAHAQEWINGSGVDESLVALNVRSLFGTTPHEFLLYSDNLDRRNNGRLSTGYVRRYQHLEDGGWWCSGVDLLSGQDSLWGCFKPNAPRTLTEYNDQGHFKQQKTIKYEHPPKVDTEIFALKITYRIGLKIAKVAGLDKEYTNKILIAYKNTVTGNSAPLQTFYLPDFLDSVDPTFWPWVINNPKMPIVITEGAKKAGALLSAGYCAIALPGIFNGYRSKDSNGNALSTPRLIPQLQVLASEGRSIYFAFDSDNKIKTIANVNKAIEKTAKLLEKQGCTCKVIAWSNEHKGVDDFLVTRGVEAFEKAYSQARTIALWKVTRLNQLTYPVAVEIDPLLRYLPELRLPPGVRLIGIKARKGRGKTHQMEELVAQAIRDGRRVLVLSHRRQLVANLCERFGIDNVNGFRKSEAGGRLGFGLCIDSLRRDSQAHFNPDEWHDALVVIDEVEQVIWHLLAAKTEVAKHRVEILRNFQQLMEVVLSSEMGQVLVADADLSDLSLDYIRSLVDDAPNPYIIHQPYDPSTITEQEKWDIVHYNHPNPKRLIADLIEHIRRGGKPMVCVSAQKMKSLFGTTNLEATLKEYFPDLKILRIDSDTIRDPQHPAYGCIEHLNKVLPEYDIVLASPSIETGVSIDLKGHFTSVWGIAGGTCSDNAVCQALARVRENIPRYLWVSKVGCGRIGNGTTNVNELFRKQKKETLAHIKLLLESEVYELHGIDIKFQNRSLWCWSKMAIRLNLGMMAYRQSVINYLMSEGHTPHDVDELATHKGPSYLEPLFFTQDAPSWQDTSDTQDNRDLEDLDAQKNLLLNAECLLPSEAPASFTLAVFWVAFASGVPLNNNPTPDEFVASKSEEVKHLGQQLKQVSVDNCRLWHRKVSEAEQLNERDYEELSRSQQRTPLQRAQFQKTSLLKRYQVSEVSPELVALDEEKIYAGMRMHYYLTVGRPYMKRKQRQRLEKMLKQGHGALFSPDFNRHSLPARIWLYEFLDFLPLLQKTQIHKDDPDLQRLAQIAKHFAQDIKSILHVTISPDDTPVVVYRKLLRPLGITKLERLGRYGERGDRHYVYANPDLSERYELFERWLASEEPLPQEEPSPVQWALKMLERLESPARSFPSPEALNQFLHGVNDKLTSVVDEVEQVCSDFFSRFWKALSEATSVYEGV